MNKNKKNLICEYLIGIPSIILFIISAFLIGNSTLEDYLKIIISIVLVILLLIMVYGLIVLDINNSYFECANCKERFKPTIKQYILGPHVFSKRKLTCPKCGKSTWCNKVSSKI